MAEKDVDTITSRDIAQRAGAGLGTLNYHFKSRDELLSQAVMARFNAAAQNYRNTKPETDDPKAALTGQIESMLRLLLKFGDAAKFALKHKMTGRGFTAERHMLRLIRQYYEGHGISELEMKLKAMQLSAVVSMAFFNREEFFRYADISLEEAQDVSRFVRALVGSVLSKPKGDGHEKDKA